MNIKSNLLTAGFIAGSALAFGAGSAEAFSFQTPSDLGTCAALPSNSCMTDDWFLIEADATGELPPNTAAGELVTKTVNGVTGIGVKDGGLEGRGNDGVPDEIDAGELIRLTPKDGPSYFEYIELAFLYKEHDGDAFHDDQNEIAQLVTDVGTGTLTVLDANQAEYEFMGMTSIINALSPADNTGGAWWRIDDPFAGKTVSYVELTAAGDVDDTARGHDYALVAAEANKVPEPASLGALGLVAGAIAATRRRKNK